MTKQEAEKIIKTQERQLNHRHRMATQTVHQEYTYVYAQSFLEGLNSPEALQRPEVLELVQTLEFLEVECSPEVQEENASPLKIKDVLRIAKKALYEFDKATKHG